MNRRALNHNIRALAQGRLALDEETYRTVVHSVTGKLHITDCDDEEANLVHLAFKKMLDNQGAAGQIRKNPQQHRFIARLMDYLRWDWQDTARFCERVTGKRSTKACNAAELSKVIRGMIAIIDQDIEAGKIQLTHTERFNYEHYVKHHRPLPQKGEPHA